MGNRHHREKESSPLPSDSRLSSFAGIDNGNLLDIVGMSISKSKKNSSKRQDSNATPSETASDQNSQSFYFRNRTPSAPLANICMRPVTIIENYVPPIFGKSEANRRFIRQAVKGKFFFGQLQQEDCDRLVDAFEIYHAQNGERIITQGETGDYFYVIESGKVEFSKIDKDGIRVLGDANEGKSFGDLALLYDCPRKATVTAFSVPCTLWRLDQNTFRQILANSRLEKDQELMRALKKVHSLKHLSSKALLLKVAAVAIYKNFRQGEYIIRKGDPGNHFYFVTKGSALVKNVVGQEKIADNTLNVGAFFGERALITDEPRSADIIAIEDTSTMSLSREDFLRIIGPFEKLMEKESRIRNLKSVPILAQTSEITASQYAEIAECIEEESVPSGEFFYTEGEEWIPTIYFVRSGKVLLSSSDESKCREVTAGGFFGIDGIKFLETPQDSAEVIEDAVIGLLMLSHVETVLAFKSEEKQKWESERLVKISELRTHRIIGVGTFGKVWLVSRNFNDDDSQTFALKVIAKRQLIQQHQIDSVFREIEILSRLDHPFIVKVLNVYQDTARVMALFQLVQGGELSHRFEMCQDGILPKKHAIFYAACILQALEYMHTRDIIYRDLKPANVLIGSDGFPIIVDFGFVKEVNFKTFTLCGTPLYIAPEVIIGHGYAKACDYWSWAILVHQMIAGATPFDTAPYDVMKLFKTIVSGNFEISPLINTKCGDLLRKMLFSKQYHRLGNLAGGTEDIKNHPWLEKVNFQKLAKKAVRVPWAPPLKGSMDVDAFQNWDSYDKALVEKPVTWDEQKLFEPFNNIFDVGYAT